MTSESCSVEAELGSVVKATTGRSTVMADDKPPEKEPKPETLPKEEKPRLPPSKMREAVDTRGKTSGPTVARRQAKQSGKKKKS